MYVHNYLYRTPEPYPEICSMATRFNTFSSKRPAVRDDHGRRDRPVPHGSLVEKHCLLTWQPVAPRQRQPPTW